MRAFLSYLLAFLSILGSTTLVMAQSECAFVMAQGNAVAVMAQSECALVMAQGDAVAVMAQSDEDVYSIPLREDWSEEHHGVLPWVCEQSIPDIYDTESRWYAEMASVTGIKAQDEDGYSCVLTCNEANREYRLISPRVDISGAEDASLVFYYYYTPNAAGFRVEVAANDLPFAEIYSADLAQDQRNRWIRVELPLTDFGESNYVRIAFIGSALRVSNSCIALDNISISNLKDHDISLMAMTVPSMVYANTKLRMEVTLRNNGREPIYAEDYRVGLYKNDLLISETRGVSIPVDGEKVINLSDIPLVVDDMGCYYMAELAYEIDLNFDDNYCEPQEVDVVVTELPGVRNLRQVYGYADRPSIALEWDEPQRHSDGQELREYRVYRDGFYIGKVDQEQRRWVDDDIMPQHTYTYRVSAVWKQGESAASEPIAVSVESRVESVAEDGDILKIGQDGITIGYCDRAIEIYDLAGRRVATRTPDNQQSTYIPLAGGIYIVRYGMVCRKIAIGGIISQ